MSANIIPNEAATEMLTFEEIERSDSIKAFIATLDPEQTRRFHEIAHHLVYLGFEDGITRPTLLTPERQGKVLAKETETYLTGVADITDPPAELKGN